ncbi:MAG TPA: sulfurtransferase [Candidatus Aquabacterium excrementipullorum]|nr:sulfurtransferase [Candidatus Aquabacterium excrementipullorum]
MPSNTTPPVPVLPLISAAELADLLKAPGDTDVLVLDCRFSLTNPLGGEQAYAQGHIPGAIYAHLDSDLSGPKTGQNGRHPLPTHGGFQATLRRWGVRRTTRVVAYDDSGGMFAARAWWMLRWAGHEAVQVLDGSWVAWRALHNADPALAPVTTETGSRTPSDIVLSLHADHVVSTQQVLDSLVYATPEIHLLDARAPDRFRGENETLDPVGGHIPGAVNRFFQLNLGPEGAFKPADQLRSEFTALLGRHPLDTVVHQCGSGVTACHNLLAMEVAGLHGTRLYAGSWSAWCADPDRPVARGA